MYGNKVHTMQILLQHESAFPNISKKYMLNLQKAYFCHSRTSKSFNQISWDPFLGVSKIIWKKLILITFNLSCSASQKNYCSFEDLML